MTQSDDETTPPAETKKPKDSLDQAVEHMKEPEAAQDGLKAAQEKVKAAQAKIKAIQDKLKAETENTDSSH